MHRFARLATATSAVSLLVFAVDPSGALAGEDDADPVAALCERFTGFDHDGDGTVEIERLAPIGDATARPASEGALVLILVEARLLEALDGAEPLAPRIDRLAADLGRDGFRARVVAASVHASARHQDGRSVLALRAFLREVATADGRLGGALLLGAFPDAFVVRSCNWRKKTPIVLRKGTPDERRFAEPVPYLRTVAEDVAHTADLVLSDLDGRWDELYVERRERLPTYFGVFPGGVPPRGGTTPDFERGSVTHEDYFHVDDGRLSVGEVLGKNGEVRALRLVPLDDRADGECSPADQARGNPIARPDIVVSRIDARGVALRPRRDVVDADGAGLLDADGKPRAVTIPDGQKVPHWREGIWEPDPVLERRLLADYLDRNHRWRSGAFRDAATFRPASLACDLGSGFRVVRRADARWAKFGEKGYDVAGRPSLIDVVAWFRRPAVLRTVRAHTDPWGSVFAKADPAKLDAAIGGPAWSWTRRGRTLVPSLAAAAGGGKADFFLLRTLWENRVLGDDAALYIHTGCHGISPPGAKTLPWNHPGHGLRGNGPSVLFYGNGLALVGRAKVFYDEPRGFAETLARGETFGDAWRRYFELESRSRDWGRVGGDIGRKRAYFWSVIGDWTLRLSPRRAH